MADDGRIALELAIGTAMAQSAIVEFLINAGIIERGPLIEHLALKRVSWEATASTNALFPVDLLVSLLAGKQPPAPPSSLH